MKADATFWTVIFWLAIGTFCLRGSIILFSNRIGISDRAKEIFSFIPAAILPAIFTPMVFFHQGESLILGGKERAVVFLFATVACYFSKSMVVTIFFGLTGLFLVSALL